MAARDIDGPSNQRGAIQAPLAFFWPGYVQNPGPAISCNHVLTLPLARMVQTSKLDTGGHAGQHSEQLAGS